MEQHAIYESDYDDLLTAEHDGWVCRNDVQADWAVRRMRFAARKRDRLIAGIRDEIETMEARIRDVEADYENETAFFRAQLDLFMESVECERTKTQLRYELPTGIVLRRKNRQPEFIRDNDALLAWAEDYGDSDLVKITKAPNWAAIKKGAIIDGDHLVDKGCGEIIPGVIVTQREPEFVVDVSKVEPALKEV